LALGPPEDNTAIPNMQPKVEARARWRISTDGGAQPRWRSDGKELFYVSADRKIMSVAVKTVPAFEAGSPSPLFASTI
jgi:eukaryotic-like serine/threonine-protein kinase